MPSGLNRTKRRIASVKSTQKITKAMEMVATVKLKRFKDGFERGLYYGKELRQILGEAFLRDKEAKSHYAKENEDVEGTCYLLITSNLGLCAGYNNDLFAFVKEHVDPHKDTLMVIGEKGKSHYSREGLYEHLILDPAGLDLSMDPRQIEKAADALKSDFNDKKYKKIVLIYTKYVNSLRFVPSMETLLPLQIEIETEDYEEYAPPLFEPAPHEMIHALLGQYLGAVLYAKLQESQLSEQASRRSAMESANDNADELIGKLTIEYNKARQGAITQEITEVVNGANSQQ